MFISRKGLRKEYYVYIFFSILHIQEKKKYVYDPFPSADRMLREMLWTSALTKEKCYWLLMLLPNGICVLILWSILDVSSLQLSQLIMVYSHQFLSPLLPIILVISFFHQLGFIFLILCLVICGSGMTNPNYTELNQLYEKYKDQGLHFEPLSLPHAWTV